MAVLETKITQDGWWGWINIMGILLKRYEHMILLVFWINNTPD